MPGDSEPPDGGLIGGIRGASERFSIPWVAMRLAAQAAEFAGWILLARHLPAALVGEVTVAYLVCRYAGLTADWGAAFGGTRLVARDPDDPRIGALVRRRHQLTAALMAAVAAGLLASGHAELIALLGVTLYRGSNREWLAVGRGLHGAAGVAPVVGAVGFVAAGLWASTPGEAATWIGVTQAVGVLASWRSAPLARHPRRGQPLPPRGVG